MWAEGFELLCPGASDADSRPNEKNNIESSESRAFLLWV